MINLAAYGELEILPEFVRVGMDSFVDVAGAFNHSYCHKVFADLVPYELINIHVNPLCYEHPLFDVVWNTASLYATYESTQ